jgi:hypothetical protein
VGSSDRRQQHRPGLFFADDQWRHKLGSRAADLRSRNAESDDRRPDRRAVERRAAQCLQPDRQSAGWR